MLKVKLVAENNIMVIKDYFIQYPFSTPTNNDNITKWNLNSIQFTNLKGSFRLTYSKKVGLNNLPLRVDPSSSDPTVTTNNLTLTDIENNNTRIGDTDSTQCLLFTRHVLFYIDEKNYYFALNADKKILPHFLLLNEEDAKENIQFFISYEQEHNIVDSEEIIFYLNLFRE